MFHLRCHSCNGVHAVIDLARYTYTYTSYIQAMLNLDLLTASRIYIPSGCLSQHIVTELTSLEESLDANMQPPNLSQSPATLI